MHTKFPVSKRQTVLNVFAITVRDLHCDHACNPDICILFHALFVDKRGKKEGKVVPVLN
jgi:hypothetical protein